MKALGETQGVKSKAAQVLNINRTTLIEKMKRLAWIKILFVKKMTKGNNSQLSIKNSKTNHLSQSAH
jgi:hypothetical protein